MVGLRDKVNRTTVIEKKVSERNVALRERSEVVELLEYEIGTFLESKGITTDRRMKATIRTEIEDIMDDIGVLDDKTIVEFDHALTGLDSEGGKVVYVILTSEHETHRIPVTRHLHDIRESGRIGKDEFVEAIGSILGEFNLSEEDLEQAVKECLTIMRNEKLIKRQIKYRT